MPNDKFSAAASRVKFLLPFGQNPQPLDTEESIMKKLLAGLALSLALCAPAWAAVDLNTATQSELEAVKGIGPAKAKAIIAHRDKHGQFKSLEDLASVRGFGQKSVAKLKSELTVGTGKP
jgi:competence protein ComEA